MTPQFVRLHDNVFALILASLNDWSALEYYLKTLQGAKHKAEDRERLRKEILPQIRDHQSDGDVLALCDQIEDELDEQDADEAAAGVEPVKLEEIVETGGEGAPIEVHSADNNDALSAITGEETTQEVVSAIEDVTANASAVKIADTTVPPPDTDSVPGSEKKEEATSTSGCGRGKND